MKRKTRLHRTEWACLILLFSIGCLSPAWASAPVTNLNLDESGWSLGLGFLSLSMPYKGAPKWSRFVPLFNVTTKDGFYLHGLTIGWNLWHPGRGWAVDLVAEPEFLHYDGYASPQFYGLSPRLASAMGGVDLVYRQPDFGVRTTVLTDLLARNHGQKIRATLFTRLTGHLPALPAIRFFVVPKAGIEWESGNLISYYFGIPRSEASARNPYYAPGSTVNELVGIAGGLELGSHWTLVDAIEYEWYGPAIRHSPLVDQSAGFNELVGLYFRFR
jgi:outer membrane scaffolding protein for murein synthesis (MipA/OmpV family)